MAGSTGAPNSVGKLSVFGKKVRKFENSAETIAIAPRKAAARGAERLLSIPHAPQAFPKAYHDVARRLVEAAAANRCYNRRWPAKPGPSIDRKRDGEEIHALASAGGCPCTWRSFCGSGVGRRRRGLSRDFAGRPDAPTEEGVRGAPQGHQHRSRFGCFEGVRRPHPEG